ncbi:5-methylcytosine-specific restriction endonuclease system specificity protein McrC [Cellulomonas sp. Leaf395]|uniref:5-methylcytosine-specific restriction endonuclease system specificity protein McrC n=1 Tax=Cellulomonas sp. Leaf395 TaxID=1736362 RepID=UPI0006FC8AC8|nr:5-methylcytosine-specific restriction endonuclease system specificity protein McrC [Cellulomonas sp. Leaf395]KQT01516.1 restriction endonuclease [Cellulomonas sp. Leaf395]
MIDRTIIIRNVYTMLAYAFRAIRATGTDRVAAEQFDHLHDLLAEILVRGVGAQVKRGLHHDYLTESDALATVRGRIDITRTIAAQTMTRGRLICDFDEYVTDTPHNRAVKAVITLLIRHGDVTAERKAALRRLLPYLDAVTPIAPAAIRWDTLTYHRSTASYRLILGVCELIVRGLLPTEKTGDTRLATWLPDDQMSALYERFLREYFAAHHPELAPKASAIEWNLDIERSPRRDQLPAMRSDVTLRQGDRTLIIDAKYYGQNMQASWWGSKDTVISGNLYQVLAYVTNADRNHDGSVSGLLLYAHTGDAAPQPDLDVVVHGNRIGARTLNLNQPWEEIAASLEDTCRWLEHH